MADVDFEAIEGRRAPVWMRSRRFVNMAAAATSVALVLGAGYWAYKLAVRNINGVPVIQAMEGPMRVKPEEPGGVIAAHQGLSVNHVAADGSSGNLADRLILAPRPVDLTDEDAAGTMVALAAPVSGRSAQSAGLDLTPMEAEAQTDVLTVAATVAVNQAAIADVTTDMSALAASLAEGAEPLSGATDDIITPEPAVTLPKGALARSIRPAPRPAQPGNPVLAAATATSEVNGATLAPGTRLVQLGAFDSEDVARAEWDKIAQKFGDMVTGKTRIVQAAKSGGRTFYRLRAMGFADEVDSRRFCSALIAENAACIPVSVR